MDLILTNSHESLDSVMSGDNWSCSGRILRILYGILIAGIIYGLIASCGCTVCLFSKPGPKVVGTHVCGSSINDWIREFGGLRLICEPDSIVEELKYPWWLRFCPSSRINR
jgi:hypothetical protein